MAYITVSELKTYLGISLSDHDAILEDSIEDAQAIIESITHKRFESSTATSRFFSYNNSLRDGLLLLDDYLASTTGLVITNGDGVEVTSTQYTLLNKNNPPYYAIKLLLDSGVVWTYANSPEDAIEIEGHWAWSTTPPNDIRRATLRLSAFLYKQRDSQVFDTTAFTEVGVIRVKHVIPSDIMTILERYVPLVG